MDLERLKRVATAAAAAFGVELAGAHPQGPDFDLVFSVPVFERRRLILMRLTAADIDPGVLATVQSDAAALEAAEHVVLSVGEDRLGGTCPNAFAGERLAAFLRRSWVLRGTSLSDIDVDRDSYALAREAAKAGPAHDRDALLWLPSLARMKLPPQLLNAGSADDLFEQLLFRMLTRTLGFRGRRLGSAHRGERVGDALVSHESLAGVVLVDAKAAAGGYTMNVDDERRLLEYVATPVSLGGVPQRVARVLVVSSSFPGPGDRRHGYFRRAERFRDAGAPLAYVQADDLVRLALQVGERAATDTTVLERIDWTKVWDAGIATRDHVASCYAG